MNGSGFTSSGLVRVCFNNYSATAACTPAASTYYGDVTASSFGNLGSTSFTNPNSVGTWHVSATDLTTGITSNVVTVNVQ